MKNNTASIQDDEINLSKLWSTMVKRKLIIISIATITTIAAVFYTWNAAPVYSGEVLIEIGDVIMNSKSIDDKPTIIQTLDNSNDLKETILQFMATNNKKTASFSVESPKGSSKLIKIIYEDTDKERITQKLKSTIIFVLKRHQTNAEFFQKANALVRPTTIIGSISITPDPIKPKKQLIVAIGLIAGLILGIFMAFFIEFIQNGKTHREP